MSKKEVTYPIRRLIVLCVGMFIIALGVIFSIEAQLGTTTLSCIPAVVWTITGKSLGLYTIILNVAMILLQIVILRRKYQLIQLLQLPLAIIFGLMIDFSKFIVGDIPVPTEFHKWAYCLIGIVLTAVGIGLEVKANLITMPAEGLIVAICEVFPVKFSNVKIGMDIVLVIIAAIISFAFLGRVVEIGLGTLAAALLVGLVMKVTDRLIYPIQKHFLKETV